MNGEFGSDIITISDEEGNDFVLEHLDTIEMDDTIYMAFLNTEIDEDDDEYGIIILKVVEEDEEDILATVDDDEVLEAVYNRFVERLLDADELE